MGLLTKKKDASLKAGATKATAKPGGGKLRSYQGDGKRWRPEGLRYEGGRGGMAQHWEAIAELRFEI